MRPRFVGRLGLADAVTATNAVVGFVAVVVALVDPGRASLAARLVLAAAIADGLDGVVARRWGSTPVGGYLDSLADVVSFGVAPAALVVAVAADAVPFEGATFAGVVGVAALFVAMAVVRLALYDAYDLGNDHAEGVQTTLAGTILAAVLLSGAGHVLLTGVAAAFVYLLVAPVVYPDLLTRDAFAMGMVQALAVLAPGAFDGFFPKLLLAWALAYLVLAPRFYWRK